MSRVVLLIAIAGCGRIGFDARDDASSMLVGHDEDGDGVADVDDVCPHRADPAQDDFDGDRVGDVCDPNMFVPSSRIALFATMMPGDQPFMLYGDGIWTQRADSIEFNGPADTDAHMFGGMHLRYVLADARIAFGFDIVNRIEPGNQMQFAVGVRSGAAVYFTELNEGPGQYAVAQILRWDGTQFNAFMAQDLATDIHAGRVEYQATHEIGASSVLEVGWPGEPYQVQSNDGFYSGGDQIDVNTNNLHLHIRYACVITSS